MRFSPDRQTTDARRFSGVALMTWVSENSERVAELLEAAHRLREDLEPFVKALAPAERETFLLYWRDLIALIRTSERVLERPQSLKKRKR